MNSPVYDRRAGFTTTEVVVAASVLVVVIAMIAPMTARVGQLWRDSRQVGLAVEELTNQMEKFEVMSDEQRRSALQQLVVSSEVSKSLPEARLSGRQVIDQEGSRIVLSLEWQRVSPGNPIQLEGWMDAHPVEPPPAGG